MKSLFSQEPCDINYIRDKKTGKPKGFAFIGYEDQRSTILAVDNFNGAQVWTKLERGLQILSHLFIQLCGRTLRVDHVHEYKVPKKDEPEEKEEKKEGQGRSDDHKWGKQRQ